MPDAVVITGPRQVEIRPVDGRAVGATEVRTRTLFSGFSHGTEMTVYRGVAAGFRGRFDQTTRIYDATQEPTFTYPLAYGYMNVGEVVECGHEVGALKTGDVVYGAGGHQTEYVVNASRLVKLPDGVEPRVGLFIANLTTTFNGILGGAIRLGETVAVFGQGVLGQLLAQLARASGAGRVIVVDLIQRRLDTALELGADVALNPRQTQDIARAIADLTGGRGADVAFEVSASYAGLQQAIRSVAPRSVVVAMSSYPGIGSLDLGGEFHMKWVNIRCSQVGSIAPELAHRWDFARRQETVLQLLPRLKLASLITHTFPFGRAAEAYDLIDQHSEDILQVVLSYDGDR